MAFLCNYLNIILQLKKPMANSRNNRLRRVFLSIFLLSGVCLLAACGEKSIATTENESEANLMFDILHTRGLHVEKNQKAGEKLGWDIIIDEGWFSEGEAAVATQVLNDHGLPRPKEVLPETTSPYGMTSPEEVKKRQNREKEIQIANHLYAGLPGVISVSVVIAQPDNSWMSLEKTPPTASVLIVQKELPPKFTHADVQNQVSGSVPELKPENIRVTITQQPLREIPLEKLAEQRRSRMIFAFGAGLITLLVTALFAIWYMLKRRKRQIEFDTKQVTEGDEIPELATFDRPALVVGDEED